MGTNEESSMTKLGERNKSLMQCCLAWQWDWMAVLQLPAGATMTEGERWFRKWIGEIEQADGTMAFRWLKLTPKIATNAEREFHVLVGGLSSGEWWFWTKRWSAIVGDREARGGYEYSYKKEGNRLRSTIREILDGQQFDAELRLGPMTIRHKRTMKVDENGMPRNGHTLIAIPSAMT
jgi:hypothetical protein